MKGVVIMRNIFKALGLTLVVVALLTVVLAGTVSASSGPMGPAPNSGDCIPDGSGFETPNGPNAVVASGAFSKGPAPNSGDCISDGSGW